MNEPLDPFQEGQPEISPERAKYREGRAADMAIEQKMLDAVAEVVKGTGWDDPEGILIDVGVVMLFRDGDGDFGVTWMSAGSDQQAEGMFRRSLRQIEMLEKHMFDRRIRKTDG